ncbi:HPr(Ser) kinase/phosphatase [Tepidanaerobacter syntrophicus]|uniref:HPr kinase/phosphorylase n=1 Tax=Tepidanaerobacter syntrophicus TaxID=224999 RepID=A0A0U9HKX2_9FIRM|nr:HPr(Ser) kinase/phosphatase [Tepidanaerobacter syntrophicus]GAQ24465.1 HPr kinase/phosphorylase [Tepidanaerobacter syntrophicus]GLI18237.1 HPr kinase/phosphorylase [Tepidanaerobacter syntrophicus]
MDDTRQKINLKNIIEKLKLDIIVNTTKMPDITVADLNRPGLELTGYFDYFAYDRVQILGRTEISYLEGLPEDVRKSRLEKFFSYDIPCVIITRSLVPPPELITIAEKSNKPVLGTRTATTLFMSRLTDFLESELAPRTTMHGVLVDIYGIGILIIGESGIGKSETAVELIKRGHRLVADDAVEIKQSTEGVLIGTAPKLIRHFLEVRGLGVIDVRTIFGAGSIRNDIKIEMVIELVEWEKYQEGDRLGLEEEKTKILDSYITKKTIPIRPGRNLAAILEVAAMDFRLKALGYNAALEFSKRLIEEISKNKQED